MSSLTQFSDVARLRRLLPRAVVLGVLNTPMLLQAMIRGLPVTAIKSSCMRLESFGGESEVGIVSRADDSFATKAFSPLNGHSSRPCPSSRPEDARGISSKVEFKWPDQRRFK
jgi:hypothetical protein